MIPAPEGYEDWYFGLYPRLLSVLVATTGDIDIAADASRDAFALALERWDRGAVMDSPTVWTYTTAIKRARKKGRRSKLSSRLRRSDAPTDPLAESLDPAVISVEPYQPVVVETYQPAVVVDPAQPVLVDPNQPVLVDPAQPVVEAYQPVVVNPNQAGTPVSDGYVEVPVRATPEIDAWAVLAGLSEREALTVSLRHIGQLTLPEVARVMGVSLDTVVDTLRGAHALLGDIMPGPELLPEAVIGQPIEPSFEDRSPYIYDDEPAAVQVPAPPASAAPKSSDRQPAAADKPPIEPDTATDDRAVADASTGDGAGADDEALTEHRAGTEATGHAADDDTDHQDTGDDDTDHQDTYDDTGDEPGRPEDADDDQVGAGDAEEVG